MLKIALAYTVTEMQWILCGRLVAPWVNELNASWKRAHATAECRRCIVNLDEVMFIDKCGERLLRSTSRITDALDSHGNMLKVEGVQNIVREMVLLPFMEMKQAVLNRVAAWRNGPPVDDVSLVLVEVR